MEMSDADGHGERLAVGQKRRKRLLGSEAMYEVLSVLGDIAVVRVISSPGLEPGSRLRLMTSAVAEMELLESSPPKRGVR